MVAMILEVSVREDIRLDAAAQAICQYQGGAVLEPHGFHPVAAEFLPVLMRLDIAHFRCEAVHRFTSRPVQSYPSAGCRAILVSAVVSPSSEAISCATRICFSITLVGQLLPYPAAARSVQLAAPRRVAVGDVACMMLMRRLYWRVVGDGLVDTELVILGGMAALGPSGRRGRQAPPGGTRTVPEDAHRRARRRCRPRGLAMLEQPGRRLVGLLDDQGRSSIDQ